MVTIYRHWIILDNNVLLETPRPEYVVESNFKEIFLTYWFIFECPCLFGKLYHNIMSDLIALRFDSAEQNLRTAVLGLTLNVSKKWRSDFIELRTLTEIYWLGEIGPLSVNTPGVDTIFCFNNGLVLLLVIQFISDLHNFLIISRHLVHK